MKEKISPDGIYKLEVLKSDSALCTAQLDAKTALLIKFTQEPLSSTGSAQTISEATAEKAALTAAGIPAEQQVIFTKCKPDGALYLVEFTLNDGTQYLAELDAVTGQCSNLDVREPPALLPNEVGMLSAREAALNMAELSDASGVQFTKAKIDRRDGTYVYELEFETAQAEYEVVAAADSGKILKYRFSWK